MFKITSRSEKTQIYNSRILRSATEMKHTKNSSKPHKHNGDEKSILNVYDIGFCL